MSHRRGVRVGVILQQFIDCGLRRRHVARHLELVLRDLEERVIGDRSGAERIDNGLQILQRFGVAMVLEKCEAAVVLPPRELLVGR